MPMPTAGIIEAMFLEPVMGEGDPGRAVPPEFYAAARELTQRARHACCWSTRSRPACARTACCRSSTTPASKAWKRRTWKPIPRRSTPASTRCRCWRSTSAPPALYRKGVYGNTMTTNPRAMDVACAVLGLLTPALRANIRERGQRVPRQAQRAQGRTAAA